MSTTASTVTARKAFDCHECGRTVEPGDDYSRFAAFPFDGEVHQGPGIWVLRVCQPCTTQYGRSMPPRRRKRKAAR